MSKSDKNFSNLQIRKLPFKIHHQLAQFLDDPDDNTMNWKALIAAMPDGTYTQTQVKQFERIGNVRGGSSTEALLHDMGMKCKTVKQLIAYLEDINHIEALKLIKQDEPVEIIEQPSSIPVMEGARVELICRARGFPPPEYTWLRNGEELHNGCDSVLVINNVQSKDSGKYSCIVSNPLNSEKSNCVELQVQGTLIGSRPPRFIEHPISAIVPVGQDFVLSCRVEKPEDCNYQWSKDGFKLHDECSSQIKFCPFRYEDEGNYTCRAYNTKGDALTRLATLQAWEEQPIRGVADRSSSQLMETARDKVALVIGNRDYINLPQHESPLVHTCGDAQSLASVLRKNVMNFKVISLVNLTYNEMNRAIDLFCDLLGPDVYGLLYFAGHGFEDIGQNYIVPIDAKTDWTPDKAICVQEILQRMHFEGRTALNVFLLDICRKMTVTNNGYQMKTYQYPNDAQSVFGFATCPGAEAYERKADANGLYMKHLLPNIIKEKKVEDMLHDVAAHVEEEVACDADVWRMRPQYYSKTVRNFSLCDPVVDGGDQESQMRNEKWLEIHRLPQKHIFSHRGILVEIRFEHTNWLSNVIFVCLRVMDLGEATMCDASLVLNALPKDFQECHFHPSTTNKMRHVVPSERVEVAARALTSMDELQSVRPDPLPVERISEIYNIQRLKKNLTLTIELKYTLRGSQEEQTKYEIKAFNLKEFGIAKAFTGTEIDAF